MRKKLFHRGLVILIIGIALVSASIIITSTSVKNYYSFSKSPITKDEWVSPEINLSSSYQIITTGNSLYVINAQFISQVNQSNAHQIGIKPNLNASIGIGTSVTTYSAPAGSYYVIYFNATQQNYQYTITQNLNTIIVLGLLLIVGVVMAVVGIIISIAGGILKPKIDVKQNLDDILYGSGDNSDPRKKP